MFGLHLSDDLVRGLLLAVPVLVLLTLLALLTSRAKAKKRRQILRVFDDSPLVSAAGASATSVTLQPSLEPHSALDSLQTKISTALNAGPKSTLPQLYFDLAQFHRTSGNENARLTALRTSAGIAAQHGPRSVHAQVRLELAEAAYALGDLTSACEHWQMARTALQEDGQRDAYTRVEKQMRDHGCPTDWVLTDF